MSDRALKNLYNPQSVGSLADAIRIAYPTFDCEAFLDGVFDEEWEDRELKQRMRHISTVLHGFLPGDYRAALDVLRRTLPALAEQGFEKMVFPDYVEVYGLEDWEASMTALEAFTQHVSGEFAVRPFVERFPERTMAQMLQWATHEHAEVRRLATEGCRPRLPWGIRLSALQDDPSPILPILEALKGDESESVRRSVANNLNDISKDNPDVVIDVLRRWQGDANEETRWITRRALRSLIKKGHADALELLGYPSEPAITVRNVAVEPAVVEIGGELTFSFEIESLSDEPQDLMIDFVVHYVKANGNLSPKVWKLTTRRLQPGEVLPIAKPVSFRAVTTRTLYAGEHAIQPKINGQLFERVAFVLR